MGTTLTGTTPQDTYDSLIKVTDNGPLSGTLKALSDGLGNDSTLSLSTTAASIAGTLAVTGNATFDTNTLFVDAANNRVGIGTVTPDLTLHLYSSAAASAYFESTNANGAYAIWRNSGTSIGDVGSQLGISGTGSASNFMIASRSGDMILGSSSAERMRITSTGNVGIGTSGPASKLHVAGADAWMTLQRTSGTTNIIDFTDSTATRIGYVGAISSNISILSAGSILFNANSAEVGRFTANGLTFNGDTAAANALDDYEEGTFTFTVVPDGSGSITLTNDQRTGRYTKIGQQVSIQASLIVSSVSTPVGSNVLIQGLPFAIANLYSAACGATVTFSDASLSYARTALPAIALQNQTQIIATIIASTIGASDEFHLNITYTV